MHKSVASLLEAAREADRPLPAIILEDEVAESGRGEDEIRGRIRKTLRVMREAVDEGLKGEVRSPSGLTGGRAARLHRDGRRIMGERVTEILSRAIATLEVNAAMGLIVAAPTAGAAGVLPSILISAGEILEEDEERLVDAMLVAGGVGGVIAHRASLAGAAGGCQAETGSAAAMGAAAVTWLAGGTDDQVSTAVALALQGMLGLICDPIGGLVEIPCIYRNASAAMQALAAAEMALAGLDFPVPADEVIDVMKDVGAELRQDPEYAEEILDDLEVFGLDQFGDSSIVVKARFKTKPIKQWYVGREYNRRLKAAFDAANVEIPFPQRTVWLRTDVTGSDQPPTVMVGSEQPDGDGHPTDTVDAEVAASPRAGGPGPSDTAEAQEEQQHG